MLHILFLFKKRHAAGNKAEDGFPLQVLQNVHEPQKACVSHAESLRGQRERSEIHGEPEPLSCPGNRLLNRVHHAGGDLAGTEEQSAVVALIRQEGKQIVLHILFLFKKRHAAGNKAEDS